MPIRILRSAGTIDAAHSGSEGPTLDTDVVTAKRRCHASARRSSLELPPAGSTLEASTATHAHGRIHHEQTIDSLPFGSAHAADLALSLIALILLGAIYFIPIWWVSLTAPNYPPESFPDGVRIHFHMNGVFNGCKMVEKSEITEDEALNCVHEMDTINHYVGMYPISAGGVVERAFSPFLLSMLGVMIVGFAIPGSKTRLAVMTAGFALIVGWMAMTFYTADGLKLNSRGYLSALAFALDQETATPEAEKRLSPAEALIAQMKASLEGDVAPEADSSAPDSDVAGEPDKAALAASLRGAFERDQAKQSAGERLEWTGSGHQLLTWHYGKSLGRYFNNPEEIQAHGRHHGHRRACRLLGHHRGHAAVCSGVPAAPKARSIGS
jgi:hypothetical protein